MSRLWKYQRRISWSVVGYLINGDHSKSISHNTRFRYPGDLQSYHLVFVILCLFSSCSLFDAQASFVVDSSTNPLVGQGRMARRPGFTKRLIKGGKIQTIGSQFTQTQTSGLFGVPPRTSPSDVNNSHLETIGHSLLDVRPSPSLQGSVCRKLLLLRPISFVHVSIYCLMFCLSLAFIKNTRQPNMPC
jgi:hypothetical protein